MKLTILSLLLSLFTFGEPTWAGPVEDVTDFLSSATENVKPAESFSDLFGQYKLYVGGHHCPKQISLQPGSFGYTLYVTNEGSKLVEDQISLGKHSGGDIDWEKGSGVLRNHYSSLSSKISLPLDESARLTYVTEYHNFSTVGPNFPWAYGDPYRKKTIIFRRIGSTLKLHVADADMNEYDNSYSRLEYDCEYFVY